MSNADCEPLVVEQNSEFAGLLSEIRGGNRDRLGGLLTERCVWMRSVCERALLERGRPRDEAPDVLQQTWLEATRDFGSFHGNCEVEFIAWIMRVLQHNVSDHVRHCQHSEGSRRAGRQLLSLDDQQLRSQIEPTLIADTERPSDNVKRSERDQQVHQAVDQLPVQYREVVRLHSVDNLTFREIGQRLATTTEAARKLWSRALRQLRQCLGSFRER